MSWHKCSFKLEKWKFAIVKKNIHDIARLWLLADPTVLFLVWDIKWNVHFDNFFVYKMLIYSKTKGFSEINLRIFDNQFKFVSSVCCSSSFIKFVFRLLFLIDNITYDSFVDETTAKQSILLVEYHLWVMCKRIVPNLYESLVFNNFINRTCLRDLSRQYVRLANQHWILCA